MTTRVDDYLNTQAFGNAGTHPAMDCHALIQDPLHYPHFDLILLLQLSAFSLIDYTGLLKLDMLSAFLNNLLLFSFFSFGFFQGRVQC